MVHLKAKHIVLMDAEHQVSLKDQKKNIKLKLKATKAISYTSKQQIVCIIWVTFVYKSHIGKVNSRTGLT